MKYAAMAIGAVLIGMSAVGGCMAGPENAAPADAGLISAGRDVAVRECASCHAIDQDMISPHANAPPMRTLLSRYEPDMLANDLIEGVRVGHDDMPFFDFNIAAADSLVAYIKSIDRNRAE